MRMVFMTGRGRLLHMYLPRHLLVLTATVDTSQITRETIPDLVKAQQSNAVAIQGVMQRMDAIAKDIEDMKKQILLQCQASSASVKSSPSTRRIPSELSVSYKKNKSTKCSIARSRHHYSVYTVDCQ